jgi:ADP-heptose:LPS heptosyltransferase
MLPGPGEVRDILIWHQGALGDLLLAGPALMAVSRHYPQARITALGHPERWGLLSRTLPLGAVWDSGAAGWAPLFAESPLPPPLAARLSRFQLALIFSPRPHPALLDRLSQAGIPAVHWIPSFQEGDRESVEPQDSGGAENFKLAVQPVAALQAGHLADLGLRYEPRPFRLVLEKMPGLEEWPKVGGRGPRVAVAPGSGNPLKNWPLAHYYEITRSLTWEYRAQVVWLAGPAESAWIPYLQGLAAAQGFSLLADQPLTRVAAVLSRCHLYVGGDSGLTHLAAAAGGGAVLALFGPTDPRIWAPPGDQVRILTTPCPWAPCAQGRELTCPHPPCLNDLTPETVLTAATALLVGIKKFGGGGQGS